MTSLRQRARQLVFRLLGKDADAVVVTFLSGRPQRARLMLDEVVRLMPGRRHFAVHTGDMALPNGVTPLRVEPSTAWVQYRRLRRSLRGFRVGMAPVLFDDSPGCLSLRRAAFLLAPRKILAYNVRGERHHLRLRSLVASWLFLRGVPLDRIFLRPSWLVPWKRDRTVAPSQIHTVDGRPGCALRPAVAVLTPHFPWPLAHGGAVRIYHLLREAAREFDIHLFAFHEGRSAPEPGPFRGLCRSITFVGKPRYREPRWASLRPPEVCEYASAAMRRALGRARWEGAFRAVQVEYTQLAQYRGDVLVEHDVTFDLYNQIKAREPSPGRWWDWWRWRRFERRAVRRFPHVVVMSDKDARLLDASHARPIPNGVDLAHFRPEPEPSGCRVLFIGSFRHFPNVTAYRWLIEHIWPEVARRLPDARLTVVAGPDALLHWTLHAGAPDLPRAAGMQFREFVADVRPLYVEANIVVVPTLVSAGTNIKVLEAMAMERAVVSTPSGCAGLGLDHASSVWIAQEAEDFAGGIVRLALDPGLRGRLARAARLHAERCFDWTRLGRLQRALWREIAGPGLEIRRATPEDLPSIRAIQVASPEASHWDPTSYLDHDCRVACYGGQIVAFAVLRSAAPRDHEILNLAVAPAHRRSGIARALLLDALQGLPGEVFLELRESNAAARRLYESLGFQAAGLRPDYYSQPAEAAIVMRFQS